MQVIDLHNVMTGVQEAIIKDTKEFNVVYKGQLRFVPFNMLDKHIKFINLSGIYNDTLELFIE